MLWMKPLVNSITPATIKRCVHLSLERKSDVSSKRESPMTCEETTYRKRALLSMECRRVSVVDCRRRQLSLYNNTRENFPYRRSLAVEQVSKEMRKRKASCKVQCDIEKFEKLNAIFATLPPVAKNILVSKNDIVRLMRKFAEGQ